MPEGNFKKYFTPEEANQRLPLVKKIVDEILVKGQAHRKIMENHKDGDDIPTEGATLKAEIEELISELEDLGCYYKDYNFEIGLVDFPSIINGHEVFLCWQSDEREVSWYHGLEEGYPGRLRIPAI